MKNRLKDNIMLIILAVVIVRCTAEILGKLDLIRGNTSEINHNLQNIRYDIESSRGNAVLEGYAEDISNNIDIIKQDVDDIGYHLGV